MARKKSNSRKKLTISVCALLVGLFSIGIAIFAVYAAHNQNTQSGFNIQYEIGQNVAVKVGASYQVENSSAVEIGTITYDVNSTQKQTVLPLNTAIELSTPKTAGDTSHSYVEFIYTFENLTDTEKIRLTATWSTFSTDVLCLNTYVDGVQFTDFTATSIASGIIINPLETKTIVIKFEVQSNGASASMKSDASTGLKWTLNHYA